MGNNIIKFDNEPESQVQPPKDRGEQEYSYVSERKTNIVGMPRVVKSSITNIQLQEYLVTNPESPVETDISIYKLRSSSYSKNLAVVFTHHLISQSDKIFMVRVQKMKGRLNQIDGLTLLEALVLLEAALNGFAELIFHSKTPFVITEKMISINESSYVRVWLNQNYALNKTISDIRVRSQNAMIHQVFSAIADHVLIEQRQAFSELRFKIIHCQRIFQAKNIITTLLHSTNRKLTLQQLVEKQMAKQSKNAHLPETSPNLNPNPSIKIPMNLGTSETGTQKYHIKPEDVIKNDEGTDRIRMVRQATTPTSIYANLTPILPTFVKPISEELHDQGISSSHIQKQQIQVSNNSPEDPQRGAIRTTSIFGSVTKQNINFVNIGSPSKSKPNPGVEVIDIRGKPTPDTLNNRIKQIEKRIGNLKQELNSKNNQRKAAPFVNMNGQERTRNAVTPSRLSRSPISQQNRPFSRYEPHMKVKTESVISEPNTIDQFRGRAYLIKAEQNKVEKEEPLKIRKYTGEMNTKHQGQVLNKEGRAQESYHFGMEEAKSAREKSPMMKAQAARSPTRVMDQPMSRDGQAYEQRYQQKYHISFGNAGSSGLGKNGLLENKSTITIRNSHS